MSKLINCGMMELVKKYQEENFELKKMIKSLQQEIGQLKGENEDESSKD